MITLNELLDIANDILYEEDLTSIDVDDDLKKSGFSSMNMLMLIMRIEKTGIKLSSIAIESIDSVRDLHQKIKNEEGGRTIL